MVSGSGEVVKVAQREVHTHEVADLEAQERPCPICNDPIEYHDEVVLARHIDARLEGEPFVYHAACWNEGE